MLVKLLFYFLSPIPHGTLESGEGVESAVGLYSLEKVHMDGFGLRVFL